VEQLSDLYSHETRCLAEERAGHGVLLVTTSDRILFIDSRAAALCEQMREPGQRHEPGLPLPLVKMVKEIRDLLELLSHPKDWEGFQAKRVIGGRNGDIFVAGIGLPPMAGATESRVLFTLDLIAPRTTSLRRMEQFNLTPREKSVVEYLLKGYSNMEIADAMGVKRQTAKEHIKHIMEKTNTTTRTGIIVAIVGP
jgi:DNA-binding CsgD family transcriptional regulator